jgi:hypothetical protein
MRSSYAAVEFTDHDPHPNNILMKKEKTLGPIVRLFDTGPKPIMTHAGDHGRTILTDYEYSYVDSMEGKPFDSSLDLFECGYNPATPDKCYDGLRFLTSVLYHYDFAHKNKSEIIRNILNTLVCNVNRHTGNGYNFNVDGTMTGFKDIARDYFFKSKAISSLSENMRVFLQNRYYKILGMLTHCIRLPFKAKKRDWADNKQFVDLFLYLFTLNVKSMDLIIVILYEVISGKSTDDLIRVMNQYEISCDNPKDWITGLKLCIERSLDYVETIYSLIFQAKDHTRKMQNCDAYTPEKLLSWLYQMFPVANQITPNTTVFWMTKKKLYKVSLKDVKKGELLPVNTEKDLWKRSQLLKELVQNYVVKV